MKPLSMKRLFHYPTYTRLHGILAAQEIKAANLYVQPPEKPVVWFSFRLDWEPTATPMDKTRPSHQLTFDELAQIDTPARIEINLLAAPLDWRAWRKLSGVKSKMVKALEEYALRRNASMADWRMSFEPARVADGNWVAIELFVQGEWRDIDDVVRKPATVKQ
jgi:hypothetical protein